MQIQLNEANNGFVLYISFLLFATLKQSKRTNIGNVRCCLLPIHHPFAYGLVFQSFSTLLFDVQSVIVVSSFIIILFLIIIVLSNCVYVEYRYGTKRV